MPKGSDPYGIRGSTRFPSAAKALVQGHQADAAGPEPRVIFGARDLAAEFLADNVPLFDCPDRDIERTYYFRWWTYRKHIKMTPAGFIVDEFLPNVSWAGKYNSISCAAGHHIYEGRWLRDPRYLDDYSRFWFHGGGEPRRYSFWVADSIWARYCVTGEKKLALDLLPELIRNYEAWEKSNLDANELFWQIDDHRPTFQLWRQLVATVSPLAVGGGGLGGGSRCGFRGRCRRNGIRQVGQQLLEERQLVGIELLGRTSIGAPQQIPQLMLETFDQPGIFHAGIEQLADEGMAKSQILRQRHRPFLRGALNRCECVGTVRGHAK